jgi:DedD protein
MGLLSFLKRSSSASSGVAESADGVQRIRTRARQRLIGAVVLIAAGVIGFPLLFETQPRPIPVDIPIEIVRKEQAPPLVMPPARAKPAASSTSRPASKEAIVTEAPPDAGREVVSTTASAAASAAASAPSRAEKKAAPTPAAAPVAPRAPAAVQEPKPRPQPDSKAVAKREAKEAAKEAAKKDDASQPSGRFVVQVGAFSDAAAAREMQQKVEKLGLKAYTQVAETTGGRRIRVRVGPFASRDDAEKAAGKIESAGLSTALFPL